MEQTKITKEAESSNTAIKKWVAMNTLEKRNSIEETLKNNAQQLTMVLPPGYTVGKLIGTVMTSIVRNPRILECTQASIFGSIWAAAQIGLDPNGLLGEGSLIPYNNNKKINGKWQKVLECQFLPGYRGFLKLAYKSPLVMSIQADVVYEKDTFKYCKGLEPILEHIPTLDPAKGEITHVYAVVKLTNGGVLFDVMNKNEIDTIRLCSKNAEGNAWEKWYDEMAKKSIIRRIFKITPINEATSKAVSLDERVEVLNQSQRNELELVNNTVFSEAVAELDPNAIYEAEYENEYSQDAPQETKSDRVMDAAISTVKTKNGNGNGNGHKKEDDLPDNIELQLRKIKADILFFSGEKAEALQEKNQKQADSCELSLKALKMQYRNFTGKEYSDNA